MFVNDFINNSMWMNGCLNKKYLHYDPCKRKKYFTNDCMKSIPFEPYVYAYCMTLLLLGDYVLKVSCWDNISYLLIEMIVWYVVLLTYQKMLVEIPRLT